MKFQEDNLISFTLLFRGLILFIINRVHKVPFYLHLFTKLSRQDSITNLHHTTRHLFCHKFETRLQPSQQRCGVNGSVGNRKNGRFEEEWWKWRWKKSSHGS
jgi:hypothetical protein